MHPKTKRLLKRLALLCLVTYCVLCAGLYFFQEKLIFPANTLPKDYKFTFDKRFEEKYIPTGNGYSLHGIWFPLNSSKGTIFYLHGNGGTVDGWGSYAETYARLGYQVFVLDYPGYGKSGGKIVNEDALFKDVLAAYDSVCRWVPEKDVIALGYSLGTGLATRIASTRQPKLLMLHAPYYNLTAMMRHRFPLIPTFLLRYKLNTSEYLPKCKMPVVIFHGDADEVIPLEMARQLRAFAKPGDSLIVLKGQGHMDISQTEDYKVVLSELLAKRF
jgi:pimeloyl-ACP methyl ester carboxylesterase